VSIRLDRSAVGAHLIWTVHNATAHTLALTHVVAHKNHLHRAADQAPLDSVRHVAARDELVIATDVDWTLLAARAIALADESGREYAAPRRQLAAIQDTLHTLIDRRAPAVSAREFLFGAGDLAFGVAILGLGFFMLMWVIATG
jgi:hypothetical protein